MKVIWNSRPRKGRDPFELFEVKNRKNAGNNRRLNAYLPRPGGKIKIVGVIEEQLRDDNVGSGRNLFFQMDEILFFAFGLDVSFRIAGHGDAESVNLPQIPDQFTGIRKSVR